MVSLRATACGHKGRDLIGRAQGGLRTDHQPGSVTSVFAAGLLSLAPDSPSHNRSPSQVILPDFTHRALFHSIILGHSTPFSPLPVPNSPCLLSPLLDLDTGHLFLEGHLQISILVCSWAELLGHLPLYLDLQVFPRLVISLCFRLCGNCL